jgi:hypothetical protein
LQPGDSLTFSSGGQGQVLSLASERAPPGETFTTYNFEVADFHTYFAGEGGVWVHNFSARFCENLFAATKRVQKELGFGTGSADGKKFKILRATFDKLGHTIDSWVGNRAMAATVFEEMAAYTPGNHTVVASVKELRAMQGKLKLPREGLKFDIHHWAEKRIQKALGILEEYHDLSPGCPLPKKPSAWLDRKELAEFAEVFPDKREVFHQGDESMSHAIGKKVFNAVGLPATFNGAAVEFELQKRLVSELKALYTNADFGHMKAWPVTRDFLIDSLVKSNGDARTIAHLRTL